MPRNLVITTLVAAVAALSGCTTSARSPVPGLAFGATQAGQARSHSDVLITSLNGGIIAPAVQQQLSLDARHKALEAEYRALERTPAGETVTWGRSDQRFRGEVVASQPYRVGSQDCRQYTHTVYAEGTALENRGAACRNPNGSWTPLA
ncbi:hypothetical protein [Oricola cellulosilytica]|uniref:Surface antigen domain-containing protein n=1 Tax=Oricola cellulosilytica TaxID=1429082 RepID=A0A4R0PA55_9HYPH|nr:hypothetical protein [Oricola cellulosilytica]TCD14132.1 hypothetical protein E0D97_08550 [Oricola cellulosilytica]